MKFLSNDENRFWDKLMGALLSNSSTRGANSVEELAEGLGDLLDAIVMERRKRQGLEEESDKKDS